MNPRADIQLRDSFHIVERSIGKWDEKQRPNLRLGIAEQAPWPQAVQEHAMQPAGHSQDEADEEREDNSTGNAKPDANAYSNTNNLGEVEGDANNVHLNTNLSGVLSTISAMIPTAILAG
ncbi:leucine Rich Repeat family protein [Colletotrichum sp. SAR 10_77]|nr:leucine Rich Repeat family protein [Colletotrichum sp. SAR 10_77]